MRSGFFALFLFLLISFGVFAEPMIVRHSMIEKLGDTRPKYYLNILRLALEKTKDSHGPYQLIPVDLTFNPKRLNHNVKTGNWIDINVSISTKQLERELLPIRIPLLKGLIGYRLFIINRGDQERFNRVKNFEDLLKLKAGQNIGWPDTSILRYNRIEVITSTEYSHLFSMLRKKRFDYFPRSVMEILAEVSLHDELILEDTLALHYPAAFYFFVNKNNSELAKRIETGLRIAISDGSFDNELFKNNGIRWALNQLKNSKRKVFELKNPLLPDSTPLQEPELWYFSDQTQVN